MNDQIGCHEATRNYLSTYGDILDNMICGMTGAKLTNSISHNFIVQMIPHHRAAIEMSRNILQYTTDAPLMEIATGIIAEQTKSIETMLEIERGCSAQCNVPLAVNRYQKRVGQILCTMFSRMRSAPATNRLDCDFMWEMIPHHAGAVEMSENALRYPICEELVPVLRAIISSQRRGIRQMQCLLQQLGC